MGIFSARQRKPSLDRDVIAIGTPKTLQSHPNTPVAAFEDGANKFAEIYGSSMVSSNRMFILSLVALMLAVTAVGAVTVLLPLKEVRPWLVEVDARTGVVNKPIEVQKVTPNIAVVQAELSRWIEAVYTLDPLRTNELFKYANVRSREKAIGQFTEFRVRERVFERLQREPGLIREVKVSSVDASQTGIAFAFLTTTERVGRDSEPKEKRLRLTMHYQLDPPKNQTDLLANPLGMYVVFFNEAEERAAR